MSRIGRGFPVHPLYQESFQFLVPILSVPTQVSITSTQATVGCSTTSLLGTLYYYISLSALEVSASDIKDGTRSFRFGNTTAITNPHTFAVTGLVEATTYYTHFIQNDGLADSNILTSGGWNTNPDHEWAQYVPAIMALNDEV